MLASSSFRLAAWNWSLVDRNGNVLDAADRLVEVRMLVAGKVEKAQEVAMPDVEEEVC